jgi:hypothetical protein
MNRHDLEINAGPNVPSTPVERQTMLLTFLRGRDVPCPVCGYNLRDLTTARCPECGDELQLQVGAVERAQGWYIVALLAACLGVGGSLLFSMLALVHAPSNWWIRSLGAQLLLVQLGLAGVTTALLLIYRRRIVRSSTQTQRLLGVVICVGVLVLSALIVSYFD